MYRLTDGNFPSERIRNNFRRRTTTAYIKYDDTILSTRDNIIKSINMTEDRFVPDKGFIGQAVARDVEVEINNIHNDINLENKEIEVYIGAINSDNTVDYINFGKFIVQKPENNNTERNTKIVAEDYMCKFNVEYKHSFDAEREYTLGELLQSVCNQSGVELATATFNNSTFKMKGNPFEEGVQCRYVLQQITKIAFSVAWIGQNNKLNISFNVNPYKVNFIGYPEATHINYYATPTVENEIQDVGSSVHLVKGQIYEILYNCNFEDGKVQLYNGDNIVENECTETGDYQLRVVCGSNVGQEYQFRDIYVRVKAELFSTDDYIKLENINEIKPITRVTLRYKDVPEEGLSITASDEMVRQYGINEFIVEDSYFSTTVEKRQQLLQAGSSLFGMNYTPITIDALGSIYLSYNDIIEVRSLEGNSFKTYCLNLDTKFNGALFNKISSDAITEVEEEYEYQDINSTLINNAFINIDKANSRINAEVAARTQEGQEIKASLELKIDKNDNGQVVSMINAVANQVTIQSDYFTLNANGEITATNGTIGGISIGNNGLFYSGSAVSDGFGLWKNGVHAHDGSFVIFHAGANNTKIGEAPIRLYQNGTAIFKRLVIESSGDTGEGIHIKGNTPFIDFFYNNADNYTTRLIEYENQFLIATDKPISFVNKNNTSGQTVNAFRIIFDGSARVRQTDGALLLQADNGTSVVNLANNRFVEIRASAFTQASSKRYKENIKDMVKDRAEKLLELRPVTFDYKDDSMMIGKNVTGLIAEEAIEIMPEIVATKLINGERVPDSIDYSKIVPYLIKIIQKHDKQLSDLTKLI